MLIDSHAHILYDFIDTDKVVSNMKEDGLEKIVTIGVDTKSSIEAVAFASTHENIFCAVGIHPDEANNATEKDIEIIDSLASSDKVVAIGEIGLDYHTRSDNKDNQKKLFIKQIEIAKKHNLPVCIHSRDSAEETYQILKEHEKDIVKPSMMHCFCEDGEYAQKYLNLGFNISFAGNATFKNYDRSFIKNIPVNRICVETDAPFLSPEPMRGRYNEPARVKYTAQKIADELEMDFDAFCKQTIENTYDVYKKMKRE